MDSSQFYQQPLEDRQVTISRAQGHFTFPTSFICIAAMNPCPCGLLGQVDKVCRDSPIQVERYRGKISAPLRDRIDMHLEVPALRYSDLSSYEASESSATVRQRVQIARKRQHQRLGGVKINAQQDTREVKEHCQYGADCAATLQHAMDVLNVLARGCNRLLKVARTIADLEGAGNIASEHLLEALTFRSPVLEPRIRS